MLKYPVSAFVEITSRCNLRCIHCYNNSGTCESDMEYDFLIRLIDDFEKNNVVAVTISGGEPLTYPRIEELLRYIKENTSLHIALNTNGILLNDDNYIRILQENGVHTIQISLDGDERIHDMIRGKGTYHRTMQAIKRCIANGMNVRVGYTVNALNYECIERVCLKVKELGVSSVALYRYMPSSERRGHEQLNLNPKILKEAAKSIIYVAENFAEHNFNIYFEKLSFFAFLLDERYINSTHCLAGHGQLNVDSTCNMSLCAHLHNTSNNLKEESVIDAWEQQNRYKSVLNTIPVECQECSYKNICKGGCKGISFALTKTYTHKDECCYKDLV